MINDYVLDLNQFQVIKTIGEGAFGKVLLIENKKTGEKFAAKSNKKSCQEQGVQKEFYREIESFIKAKYPSILHFIGHNMLDFDSNPYPTFVTEYMPNSSLLDILDCSKTACAPIKWDDTKRYINLIGIALGMKHLHSKSIVHRDLKPANILLDEDFYPRICDFGLSKLSDKQINELLMSSTGVGTPLYMAPEIFTGQPYTPKVDIYAFGIMAFEIITNIRKPIQISNIKGQQNQFFLQKCLSQDPVNRPTFYEVCKYMVTKDFIDLFGQINYDEVDYFLDLFDKDPEAVFIHALFLSVNGNKKDASDFYRKLADDGFPDAMNNYANMLAKGEGIQMNKEEAIRYYKMAIDKGNSDAMNNYANMLEKGEGIQVNKEEAIRYYKMAIDKGNSDAMNNYANMLAKGEGIQMNKEEAIRYYKMAIDKGNSDEMNNYANMLAKGEGTQMNKCNHQQEILSEEQLRELPPPLPKSSCILGIDFGTTTTRFGVYKNGKFDDRISEIVLPSSVAFNRYSGKPYFNFLSTINKKSKIDNKNVKGGFSASGHYHLCLNDDDDPDDIMINDDYIVVPAIKRLLGREISQEVEQSLPFELKLIIRSKKKEIKITDTISLSFEQIAALILAEGKRMVEDKLKEDISDAVLCVPGFYSINQKTSIKNAAQIAGFNVVKLISETVAVITALKTNDGKHLKEIQDLDGSGILTGIGANDSSSNRGENDDESIKKAIVVKFGGGNFDTTIVEFSKDTATIDKISGDTSIGGVDIDKAIAHFVLSKIPKDKASSIKKSKAAIRVLEQACETFRIKNSKVNRSQNAASKKGVNMNDEEASKILVNGIIDNFNLDVQITESEYASILEPFLEKLTECLEDLFQHNTKTKPNDIKELIFVGGVMKTPSIRDAVINFLVLKSNNSTTSTTPHFKVIEINPKGIILGASIQAAIIKGDTSIKTIKVKSTVILSIGISLANGTTCIIIPRGKTIPYSYSTTATTFKDNQRNVTFDIVEGERTMAKDNIKIGNVCVKGIENAPRGVPDIEIKMRIDEEGILIVEAHDKKTGVDMKTRIMSKINLQNHELKRMLDEAELNKQKDVYRRKQAKAKAKLKFYLFEMESKGKSIKNHEFWDKIEKYYQWIDENNDAKPSEYINMYRKSKEELYLYINNQ